MPLEYHRYGSWHCVDATMLEVLGHEEFWAAFLDGKPGVVKLRWRPVEKGGEGKC